MSHALKVDSFALEGPTCLEALCAFGLITWVSGPGSPVDYAMKS